MLFKMKYYAILKTKSNYYANLRRALTIINY